MAMNIAAGIEELDHSEIIEEALERFEAAQQAWSRIHSQYREDLLFANGEQWDEKTARIRSQEDRSMLNYNKLLTNIKYIVNNARMNTPGIVCSPITEGANKNTAKVFDGIIKYIQYTSNSKTVYANALKGVCAGGLGAFQVLVEEDIDGDIGPLLKSIKDPTTVFIDPEAERTCFEDMKYAFIINWMDKKLFKRQYPDACADPIDDSAKSWYQKDRIQVAEYWFKIGKKVYYAIITGSEVLSMVDNYQGKYIPVVYITGEEYVIDDVREFKGIVRDVKDIQRLLNYAKSETADYLARSAKQQWLMSEAQLGAYKSIWDSNNIQQYNYLPYASSADGKPTPIEPQVPPAALITAGQEADADLKASIGIRDPLRDIPGSQSGKAIGLQISEANVGIYNFYDSLKDGIQMLGKILVDLIPHYYDEPRIIQIMGEDGQINPVKVNQPYLENGQWTEHMLNAGKYTIRVSAGPSYESQRTETAERLSDLVAKYPQMMQVAGDLIVKNLNFEGAEEMASRLQATIAPNILAASNSSNGDTVGQLQASKSQINQMQQQMKAMQQENQMLKMEQTTKMQSEQMKHQQAMELENLKFKNQMILREQDSKADIALEKANMEHSIVTQHIQNQSDVFEKQLDHKHDLIKMGHEVIIEG